MRDVLIIGAGPAGSAAALRLARAGRSVLLVDRCRFPRPKPCGEYFNPQCVRELRALGMLPEVTAAGARRVHSLVLGSPWGGGLESPFSSLVAEEDTAISLGRESLDAILVNAARGAGSEIWEGALMREPLLDDDQVAGALIEVDGSTREVGARITLAADGLRSRFARRLGLALGDGGRRRFGVTGRRRLRPDAPEQIAMHAGLRGCCGVSVRGDTANLGMVVDEARIREVRGDLAGFFAREARRYPALDAWLEGDPEGVMTVGPLTWRTRAQSAAGCLLLGDAAGFYDPFTGQGVTFALLTAALAAEVADAALAEGDLSAGRLSEYSQRRRRMLEPRIWVQKAIQGVVSQPWLLERVLDRLRRSPETARTLLGVTADVLPATRILSPVFLARLLV